MGNPLQLENLEKLKKLEPEMEKEMEIESYTINWSSPIVLDFNSKPIKFVSTENWDKNGFYMIFAGTSDGKNVLKKELLYIGQEYDSAHKRNIEVRVKEEHERGENNISVYDEIRNFLPKNPTYKAFAKAGIIVGCSKESQELYDDIEALLIYNNLPKFNTKLKENYKGRPLIIKNIGAKQIEEKSYSPPAIEELNKRRMNELQRNIK